MSAPHVPLLTRRQLLIGGSAAAGVVLLGGCGDDGETVASGTTSTTASSASSGLALAQFFGGPLFVAGEEARLPFGVADQDGLLPTADTPEQLSVQILDPDGASVGAAIEVDRHADGLPRAYFPLRVTVDDPGIYTARTEIDAAAMEMSFQVDAASGVTVIRPGAAMPALETPTTDDARGVDPICTRDPVCPLHDVTLAAALAEGKPVALLVATPAFCQIAICGPVLDVLLDAVADHPDVRFLHAEVYAAPAKDLETYAPVVAPLGLHFEPCLVLVGADGTVVDRVDTIYDRAELQSRLELLA
jgi:hypothetical protein